MKFMYPNGKAKALTFSYDDNQIHDRKLVEIFDKYGLRGTFHMNSGQINHDGFIRSDEVKGLYRNHEVACHGVDHKNPTGLSRPQLVRELAEDRKALEEITGSMVTGLSYAFGLYSPEVKDVAKSVGIKYSRTVNSTNGYFPPADFLEWNPTCHHDAPNLLDLGRGLLDAPDYIELPMMYVWGHSFEFARNNNWEVMEEFAKLMSGKEDVWYATNIELYTYITAIRSLEYTMDGKVVYNPTAVTVYFEHNGNMLELASGETLTLA